MKRVSTCYKYTFDYISSLSRYLWLQLICKCFFLKITFLISYVIIFNVIYEAIEAHHVFMAVAFVGGYYEIKKTKIEN